MYITLLFVTVVMHVIRLISIELVRVVICNIPVSVYTQPCVYHITQVCRVQAGDELAAWF